MEKQQRVSNGKRAKEVIEDPFFAQIFEDIQKEQIAKFVGSDNCDTQTREEAFWTLKGLEKFKGELARKMLDGIKAQKQLDKLNGGS